MGDRQTTSTVVQSLRDLTGVTHPRVVGSVTLGHGANEFFSIALPPIIPFLVTDVGISYAEAGLLLTVFFVMYSVFQLPAGMLGDRLGKKRLLVGGLVLMTAGIFLASTAQSYPVLLGAQAIAGIGGSTFHPTGMAMISDVETPSTEGKAMGVFGFGGAIGTMAAPVLIGGLAALGGWRLALIGATILGVVITIAFLFLYQSTPTQSSAPRPDGGRRLTIRNLIQNLKQYLDIPISRGIGIVFLATIFLSIEKRAIHTFTTAYIAAEVGGSASIGNLGFFALLVGGSLASLGAGKLADRFNRGMIGGLAAISTAGLVGATVYVPRFVGGLPPAVVFGLLTGWFFLIGVTLYACSPVKNALVSQEAQRGYSGSLFGVIQTASAMGSAIGPAVFGVLATRWGVVAAYPAIATVGVVLAGLFFLHAVLQ